MGSRQLDSGVTSVGLLCTVCDKNVHRQNPLHDQQVWLDGFWLLIAPTSTLTGSEASLSSQGMHALFLCHCGTWIMWDVLFPLQSAAYHSACQVIVQSVVTRSRQNYCLQPQWGLSLPYEVRTHFHLSLEWKFILEIMLFNLILIGSYDFMDGEPTCSACKSHLSLSQPNSVIQEEFWPGSARRKSQYIFDQDLSLFFDLLQKNMPGVSESGFIRTLEMFSEAKGRVGCMFRWFVFKILLVPYSLYISMAKQFLLPMKLCSN